MIPLLTFLAGVLLSAILAARRSAATTQTVIHQRRQVASLRSVNLAQAARIRVLERQVRHLLEEHCRDERVFELGRVR